MEITQRVGAWIVRMWWPDGAVTGGPQQLWIEPAGDAANRDVLRGISTAVLRDFDLVGAVEKARAATTGPDTRRQERDRELAGLTATAQTLFAKAGLSEEYLAVLAAMYRSIADSGEKALVPLIASQLGRPEQTIKNHLKRARKDGLLTAVAGKAGGELTEKATAILATVAPGSRRTP
ncbi:sigma-70 region 4 domain-containing protein [Streptomyces sp. ISL-11]|uniref:sigma-70 region 4 domain-containing protein n=1 Tax=Streptomyces sp. ISL-11 TaxID=2819174 RepID=UPI002036510A|nr:sigma-70 region 4 domain-containing protein [Streptomyces sp. ISL-11]